MTLSKKQKLDVLKTAMTTSERADGEAFTHFADEAPEELRDIFLAHYEVKDVDYQIFSRACDIVVEAFDEHQEEEKVMEYLNEYASGSASVYTQELLSYLDVWNQEEISDIMNEYSTDTISTACAIWYDEQVLEACMIIKSWVETK